MRAEELQPGDTVILRSNFELKPPEFKLTCNGKDMDLTIENMGNNTYEITIK